MWGADGGSPLICEGLLTKTSWVGSWPWTLPPSATGACRPQQDWRTRW